MTEKYIRVETNDEGEAVSIHANREGIEYLYKIFSSLLNSNLKIPTDVNLMTPEWGGNSLVNDTVSEGCILVNNLKIYRWE